MGEDSKSNFETLVTAARKHVPSVLGTQEEDDSLYLENTKTLLRGSGS